MTHLVSVLPGRIRVRHPALREDERYRALSGRLAALATLTGDPAVGSLLLTYDPSRIAPAWMEERVRAEVAAVLPAPASGGDPARRGRPLKRSVNRAAKIGAVAAMAVSLAALGSSRRLHAQAGLVAVALTLVHMAVHWRQTLR